MRHVIVVVALACVVSCGSGNGSDSYSGGQSEDERADARADLEELARADAPPPRPPRRVVAKAREFIHELRGRKLSLDAAAATIGVSPIYLTQARASERIPLYRYSKPSIANAERVVLQISMKAWTSP